MTEDVSTLLIHPELSRLQPIAAFVQAYPPQEPYKTVLAHTVYLRPRRRLTILVEHTGDIGYGHSRNEAMAEAGVNSNEEDSREFAKSIMESIGEHMSLRNMRDLSAAINQSIAEVESRRRPPAFVETVL